MTGSNFQEKLPVEVHAIMLNTNSQRSFLLIVLTGFWELL